MHLIPVELEADLESGSVRVKQLGSNSSALDGIEMIKDRVYTMKPSSTLYILTGLYPQKLKLEKLSGSEKEKERSKSASEVDTKVESSNRVGHDSHRHSSCGSENRLENRSSQNKHGKSSTKKRPSSSEDSEVPFKKPKLQVKGEHTSPKHSSTKNSDDEEKKHMADVSAKLELLKSNAKRLNTPEKGSAKESSQIDTSKHSKPERKEHGPSSSKKNGMPESPAKESKWEQFDTLYVYTSKGLESRSKVKG